MKAPEACHRQDGKHLARLNPRAIPTSVVAALRLCGTKAPAVELKHRPTTPHFKHARRASPGGLLLQVDAAGLLEAESLQKFSCWCNETSKSIGTLADFGSLNPRPASLLGWQRAPGYPLSVPAHAPKASIGT